MLPPGRLRLATRPTCTGLLMEVKTMGMVAGVAFGTGAAGVVNATSTVTWRCAKSAGAPLIRDRSTLGVRNGPGSAAHHCAPRAPCCAAPGTREIDSLHFTLSPL